MKRDLFHVINLLQHTISSDILESLGIEGSLAFGLAHKYSDIDIIVNGQKSFEQIKKIWKEIVHNDQYMVSLENLPTCQKELIDDRQFFIPYNESEILFHELRKNYAYIVNQDIHRKINIVGKLNSNDQLYNQRKTKYYDNFSFKPIGLCNIKGVTVDDQLGNYIPSIYDTKLFQLQPLSNLNKDISPKNVSYIIDYIGSYYMHLKKGEVFESVGMLEEIYKNGETTGKYRLSLNPWDGHIENRMFLKTIAKCYEDYIKENIIVSKQNRPDTPLPLYKFNRER